VGKSGSYRSGGRRRGTPGRVQHLRPEVSHAAKHGLDVEQNYGNGRDEPASASQSRGCNRSDCERQVHHRDDLVCRPLTRRDVVADPMLDMCDFAQSHAAVSTAPDAPVNPGVLHS